MVTQELKDKGIHCRGQGFNCCSCKDAKKCVEYVECENPFKNSKKDNMIKTYRKKPVKIKAIQLKDFSQATVRNCLEFMGQTVNTNCMMASDRFDEYCSMLKHQGGLFIETLEGKMLASEGDFIIKGVSGEFYPCKPDIFDKTYELV